MNFAKVGLVLKDLGESSFEDFLVLSSCSMIFLDEAVSNTVCLLMRGFKDFLLALFAHDLCFVVLSLKLGF